MWIKNIHKFRQPGLMTLLREISVAWLKKNLDYEGMRIFHEIRMWRKCERLDRSSKDIFQDHRTYNIYRLRERTSWETDKDKSLRNGI